MKSDAFLPLVLEREAVLRRALLERCKFLFALLQSIVNGLGRSSCCCLKYLPKLGLRPVEASVIS